VPAAVLLNRFAQAQELERSALSLAGGYHFQVPCRMRLVFVASAPPASLLDDAALRRVGYKIPVGALDAASYRTLLRQQCLSMGVAYDDAAQRYLVDELHAGSGLPLLACYPREIVSRVADFAGFMGEAARLSIPALDQAWISMFAGVERNSMKNKRALLMMALAIVFGLAAVALASRWLLRQTPGASNKIVVAAQDVNLGQRLTPEMLRSTGRPRRCRAAPARWRQAGRPRAENQRAARRAFERGQAGAGRHAGRLVGADRRRQARHHGARERCGGRGRVCAAGEFCRHHRQHAVQ
jgi:hypothetical protein